jgi:hypothetical protein
MFFFYQTTSRCHLELLLSSPLLFFTVAVAFFPGGVLAATVVLGARFSASVADPGCSSKIPDPDFYPSRIPDLGSRIQKQQQKRGVKKKFLSYLFM